MTVGEKIKRRREELGLSQEDLANKCGWTNRSSISKIETSVNGITIKKVEVLSKALDVSEAYLLGYDETDKNETKNDLEHILLMNFRLLSVENKNKILTKIIALNSEEE